MQPRPQYATPPDPIEIRVEKVGLGKRRWRWVLLSGTEVRGQSEPVFGGAEEAYVAGRLALEARPLKIAGRG